FADVGHVAIDGRDHPDPGSDGITAEGHRRGLGVIVEVHILGVGTRRNEGKRCEQGRGEKGSGRKTHGDLRKMPVIYTDTSRSGKDRTRGHAGPPGCMVTVRMTRSAGRSRKSASRRSVRASRRDTPESPPKPTCQACM